MIYFVQAETVGNIKIGLHEGTDANDRVRELQTGSPVKLILLGTIPGGYETEQDLHRRFAFAHLHGEWFKPVPELLEYIGKQAQGLSCGKTEVQSRFVQIKVLTVGNKSFTKSMLDQFPSRHAVDWKASSPERIVHRGTPWGIIRQPDYRRQTYLHYVLLWQNEGSLLKQDLIKDVPVEFLTEYHTSGLSSIPADPSKASSYWDLRNKLIREYAPAWAKALEFWFSLDHLFIGA